MDASGRLPASRHLGLDLGGTNIKWVVVERDAANWRMIDRDQVPTPSEGGPDASWNARGGGAEAIGRSPYTTLGIGIPGLYDPAAGTTRFSTSLSPGRAAGGRPARRRTWLPTCLINDAR
jgi:predicted NBD/HSP70 family sugar kinase